MEKLLMYRPSQAASWEQAQADGAIHTVPLYGNSANLRIGVAADALEAVTAAVNMVDYGETVRVRLVSESGGIIDETQVN